MEASKRITTNIPTGSPLKQEHIHIPALFSRSPLLAFSIFLSKPPLLKPSHLLPFPVISVFLKTPQTSLSNSIFFFRSKYQTLRDLSTASPRFSFSSTESPLGSLQKTHFFLPNVPFFPKTSQTSSSQHPHHTLFFPFSYEKITSSFGTPQHIQFPHFPRWATALSLLHNSLPTKNPHGSKVGCNQLEKWPKSDIKPSS